MKNTYTITGMTCSGCQFKVQHLLSQVNGVSSVAVDLAKGQAEIKMDKHVPAAALQLGLKDYPKYQLSDGTIKSAQVFDEPDVKSWAVTYRPILLIFGYITVVACIAGSASGGFSWITAMRIFMAGFFLTFSFFKLLDVQAFADSYAGYDIIARKFRNWGVIYAFLELFLGLAFVIDFQPVAVNWITLAVMSVSIVGVLQSVLNKRQIKCACLGAVFNLPMSTVTIIEDGLMIGMSVGMLLMMK